MSNITRIADSKQVQKAMLGRKLNKAEATELTTRIRQAAGTLWQMVAEAHDRKAWQALGYESWKDYCTAELQMSESGSYRLIQTGRIMRTIADATGDEEILSTTLVTAREVPKVTQHLTTFKRELKRALADGMDIAEAVREAIYELPGGKPKTIDGEVVPDKDAEWARLVAEDERRRRDESKPDTKQRICAHCHGTGYV